MPISIPLLRALVVAGASAGAIVDAVEAAIVDDKTRASEEAQRDREALQATRASNRERKRLQRHRDKVGTTGVSNARSSEPVTRDDPAQVTQSQTVTRDIPISPVPLLSSPTPPSNNPLTPFDDVDVRLRAASRLADQVMEVLGIDRASPPRRWIGFADELARNLEAKGWRCDLVLTAARKVAASFAKRTGERHPESFGYLTRPIENEHAHHERELALMTPVAAADPAAIERARAAQLWLHRDDERFKAWDAHFTATRGRGLPIDGKGGWHVATDWPPGHPRASEAA